MTDIPTSFSGTSGVGVFFCPLFLHLSVSAREREQIFLYPAYTVLLVTLLEGVSAPPCFSSRRHRRTPVAGFLSFRDRSVSGRKGDVTAPVLAWARLVRVSVRLFVCYTGRSVWGTRLEFLLSCPTGRLCEMGRGSLKGPRSWKATFWSCQDSSDPTQPV